MRATLIALVLLLLTATPAFAADVVINEFSSDTSGTSADPDWIEVVNKGSDIIDLSLYRLRDATTTNKLDLSGSLAPNDVAVFDWTNKLNKSGDMIKLLLIADESNQLDSVSYGDQGSDVGAPSAGQSAGRLPDGGSWTIFSSPTKGSSNNASVPAPTATPTPTVTPKPTPTDKPTPTPKPTATPKPTPTTKPSTSSGSSVSPAPQEADTSKKTTSSHMQSANSGDVLSAEDQPDINLSTHEASPSISPAQTTAAGTLGTTSNIPRLLLIGLGLCFIASGIILIWRKRLLLLLLPKPQS